MIHRIAVVALALSCTKEIPQEEPPVTIPPVTIEVAAPVVDAAPSYQRPIHAIRGTTSVVVILKSHTPSIRHNVRNAGKYVNGAWIDPGEVFSFNETVGERTIKRRFTKGPILFQGVLVDGIGGGVCVLATALYQVAMQANLTIVERHSHSRPRPYAKPGMDAAVNWESPRLDLKLRNDRQSPVQIELSVYEDGSELVIDVAMFSGDYFLAVESKWIAGTPTPFRFDEIEGWHGLKSPILHRIGQMGYPGVRRWQTVKYTVPDMDIIPIGKPWLVPSDYKPIHQVTVVRGSRSSE